jgi:hypothetical protein
MPGAEPSETQNKVKELKGGMGWQTELYYVVLKNPLPRQKPPETP